MAQARDSSKQRFGIALLVVVVLAAGLIFLTEVRSPSRATAAPSAASPGYWLIARDGGVYNFGTSYYGSTRGQYLSAPVVGGAATPSGLGYWLVASDGGIFTYGDAVFYGSMGGHWLSRPIVGIASTSDGRGYWLVASDGGIFTFGDATFYGSMGGAPLNRPIVGMASTSDGRGYWLVASDGGIFTFGDATFYGSMGGHRLNQPVVGMAGDAVTRGYWMVASDGGIFSFNAPFLGSTGGQRLNQPITGMTSLGGSGYWMVARDGGVFTFGDVPYLGSTGSSPGPAPIVTIAATSHGYPFPPGSTGYDISRWQCSDVPTVSRAVSIVQVSGGAINSNAPNPCYAQEAAWAGPRISDYIFMDGLPSPAPSESLNGPAGSCSGSVSCESYNFGYYWATKWVGYSHGLGISPTLWWLDVETSGAWSSSATSNSQVIAGAVAGLRATGVQPGIYATALQWGEITGNQLQFAGIPLWVPGASNISSGTYSAYNFCNNSVPGSFGWEYAPFAGGRIVLVQYGWGAEYTGPPSPYDQDYAC